MSGNQCAFPDFPITIVQDVSSELLIEICHIEAAEPDGQRYNPKQTDDDRRHFDNLILLCPNHHTKTNDVNTYTTEILKEMKRSHEKKMLFRMSATEIISKYPADLAKVINQISISGLFGEELKLDYGLDSFKIDDKILYNDIKQHVEILNEYKVYQGKLNKIYEQIELQGSFKKEQLLNNIKQFYLKAKGKYTDGTIISVRQNADKLIDEVERLIWEVLERSNNLKEDVSYESIELSVQVIIVDSFMRCKILEQPK